MLRGFFDLQTPAFRPLWLRVMVVGTTIGWAAFELMNGALVWALVFGAAGLWCAYQFFVAWTGGVDDGGKDGR